MDYNKEVPTVDSVPAMGHRRGFGMHMTLDLGECDLVPLQDLRLIHDVMRNLVTQLCMTALMPPFVFHYNGGANVEDEGITGFIVIAESHLSIHTFPHKRFVFADVFSCRSFDANEVARTLSVAFGSRLTDTTVVERGKSFA